MAVASFWLWIQSLPRTLVIRSAEDYTERDPSSPGEAGCLCLQLEAAAGWIPFILFFSCFTFFWPLQLQPRQLLSTASKRSENEAKGNPHKPEPDAVHNIPGEELTTESSALPLGEGKSKQLLSTGVTAALLRQEPLLPQELLEAALFPRTDAKGTCIDGEQSLFKGRLAAMRTGFGSSLWLWARLQERCWSWGQLHGVSGAGGVLLSWGGTRRLFQGVGRSPGPPRGGGIHLLPLFLLPLHQLSEQSLGAALMGPDSN